MKDATGGNEDLLCHNQDSMKPNKYINNFFKKCIHAEWSSLVAQMVESTYNAGDPDFITESGRCPGEGDGYPLRYSCLEDSMDRGAWQAIAHGVAKNQTQLSY